MCPKCKQEIYSRCSGDLHTCFCCSLTCSGKIASDKIKQEDVVSKEVEINATQEQMKLDFLYNSARFGIVKPIK